MRSEAGSTVRPITADDDDRVVDTIVSSTLFEAGDHEMLASLLAAHHAGQVANGQRWVAVVDVDGQIAGTAMYRPIEAADRAWDLTLIAVSIERQRGGIGHRLMSHVEQQLRGEDQRTLVVQTSGLARFAPTRAFYHRLEYAERGRVPDYWGSGDDMILFSKALDVREAKRIRAPELRIVELDTSQLDALRPLWLQLHHHHQASLPDFAGFVTDDQLSWGARRALYQHVLDNHHGFVLAAQHQGQTVGYTVVELHDGADDTFAVGPRHAEILTLVVDAEHRGGGLGSRLLDEVDAKLAGDAVHDLVISVMLGNDRARRFYERRGLVAAETYLWRVDTKPT